eukprot:UN17805
MITYNFDFSYSTRRERRFLFERWVKSERENQTNKNQLNERKWLTKTTHMKYFKDTKDLKFHFPNHIEKKHSLNII